MTGALPPSSICTGFMARAASSVRCLPTPVEPVKVTRRVMGEPISLSEICPESPRTRFSTPGGSPASSKHRTSSQAVPGVSAAGFRMTEQPAAESGRGLARGRAHGDVPRREGHDRSDRLAQDQLLHSGLAWDDETVAA